MSTQAAVSNQEIETFIILQLEGRPLKVESDWETTGRHLTIEGVSRTRMNRRLGSLIKRKVVIRERRPAEYPDDTDRPITYLLHPRYVHA